MCVIVFVLWMFFFIIIIDDKIANIKEEFNILVCSWSRIINLYVSCISNIRWQKTIIKISLTRQTTKQLTLGKVR